MWLTDGSKTKIDLIAELEKAPGKGNVNMPVPYYKPGPVQWSAHRATEKIKQFVGGWRAGKSKWLGAELLPYLFKDHARVWIVGNDYQLAREEFDYVEFWLRWLGAPIARISKPQEGRWQIWLKWGAHISTQTAADVTKIEAANLDAAGVAEAGQIDQAIIIRLLGRVFQKRGPLCLAGSLEDTEPWYINRMERHENGGDNWRSFRAPSWSNVEVFPGGEEDEGILEQKAIMPEEDYRRKVCAEIVRPREIVFGEFDHNKHVTPMEFTDSKPYEGNMQTAMQRALSPFEMPLMHPEPEMDEFGLREIKWKLPERSIVHLAIDPGYRNYAVVACVKYQEFVYVIDEVYVQGGSTPEVIDECRSREWWPQTRNGTHVIDVAGRQHNVQTGQTEVKMWFDLAGIHLHSQKVHITDGILKLRTFLVNPMTRRPKLWFDPKCEQTIREFGLYRYKKHIEGRPMREEPIDEHNHAIKALAYWLVRHFPNVGASGAVRSESYITTQGNPWDDEQIDSQQYPPNDIWHDKFGWNGM